VVLDGEEDHGVYVLVLLECRRFGLYNFTMFFGCLFVNTMHELHFHVLEKVRIRVDI